MKKIILSVFCCITLINLANAQETSTATKKKKKDWSQFSFKRAGSDHIMLQLSKDNLAGAPDSINSHLRGFSKGLNIYVMWDKPFKTNPHFSVAFGFGIGSNNIFFNKMKVDIAATGTTVLPFTDLDSANHFKKYKLSTNFVDVPVELRYMFNPEKENKSWKLAVGGKVGLMLNAHTKGKTLVDKNGTTVNSYTEKVSTKRFFNTTRLVATGRVGYGHFSLFGAYQVNSYLKDGSGADMHPYQIGLTLSGL